MIEKWLKHKPLEKSYSFSVFDVSENNSIDDDIKRYLNTEILDSYRPIDFLNYLYSKKDPKDLVKYLEENVLPSMKDQFSKNVWQGDVGEILAALIVTYLKQLKVPLKKIRWKLNKEKSVFATDMVAHNDDGEIKDMYYYEIKTKQDICNKSKGEYISVIAYNSINKDKDISNEELCDFLSRLFFDKHDYKNADKYNNIVYNGKQLNKYFEIYIIGEKSTYDDIILSTLNNLKPKLSPLSVTVVLIDGFKDLIVDLRSKITSNAIDLIYKGK